MAQILCSKGVPEMAGFKNRPNRPRVDGLGRDVPTAAPSCRANVRLVLPVLLWLGLLIVLLLVVLFRFGLFFLFLRVGFFLFLLGVGLLVVFLRFGLFLFLWLFQLEASDDFELGQRLLQL